MGWHQVGGAYLGQAADRGRQVTCGEVPERISVNLGIFSKGAKQRAPRNHAEPLPNDGATRRTDLVPPLGWHNPQTIRGHPPFVWQVATELKLALGGAGRK